MSSAGSNQMQSSGAAAPASGKYGGFGSEDIARLGYNTENKFNAPYDPYTKEQSAPSQQTHAHTNNKASKTSEASKTASTKNKKKSKKSKKDDSYDSESESDKDSDNDSDDDSDSSDSEEKRKKAKRNKKKQKQGLAQPPSKSAPAAAPKQQA